MSPAATVIAIKPSVPKDWDIIIATSNHKMAVNKCELMPSTSSTTWTGGGANSHTDQTTPTWVVNVDYAQDWETVGSFAQYLFDNAGQTVDLEFRPKSGGIGFKASVIITPGAIGGAINSYMTASVSLGVTGKPTRLTALVP